MSRSSGEHRRVFDSCPVGTCRHPAFLHDVDEIDWPRIERCTVTDCDCAGIVVNVGEVAA